MNQENLVLKIWECLGANILVVDKKRIRYVSHSLISETMTDSGTKDMLGADAYQKIKSTIDNESFVQKISVNWFNIKGEFRAFPYYWQGENACLLIQNEPSWTVKDSIRTNLHKISNVFSALLGISRLALEDFANARRYLEQLEEYAQNGIQYTTSLQNKILKRDPFRSERNIHLLMGELRETTEKTYFRKTIKFEIFTSDQQIMVNPMQFKQLFRHVVDYIFTNNTLEKLNVKLSVEQCSTVCQLCESRVFGPYAVLWFYDENLTLQDCPTIFQPNKAQLGIYFVKGMVHDHKGHIAVDDDGRGLKIFFPYTENFSTTAIYEKKILVLDKDYAASSFINELLTSNGYPVELMKIDEFTTQSLIQRQGEFSLIIMEQELGEHTATELSRVMSPNLVNLPVIIHSYYDPELAREDLLAMGVYHWIQRPLSADRLLQIIRGCLSRVP